MSQVRLSNVNKEYDGGILAVKGLDLTVDNGEFVVVVGPSGCGRSMTFRMMAGFEIVASGEIAIGEHAANDVRPQDRNIAMVSRSYALYPHMTVRENMSFGLRLVREDDDEVRDRVEDAAEMLEISELLDDLLKQLSGGQQQRVTLGRVIVHDPDVLLMDGPLSNLDAKLRMQMRTEIQWIQKDFGVTTVYVIHDQTEVMTMADRIVILNDGKFQQVDPPERCCDEPDNELIAGSIRLPPMNFLEMTITDDDGGVRFESPSFELMPDVDVPSSEYTFGVRLEDFTLDCEGGYVETAVDVVGPVGSDNFLYPQTVHSSSGVVVWVESELRPAVGDEITLGFDVDNIYLFGSNDAHVAVSETRLTDSARHDV